MSEALSHLVGDYIAQSDWMANEKTKHHPPAVAHAVTYTLCFVPLTRNWKALSVIGLTHFVIDRWRLARYLVWGKNQLAPRRYRHKWDSHVSGTGYHMESLQGYHWKSEDCKAQEKPAWMSVWLMIIADNTLHLLINKWALRRWGHD